MVAPRGPGGVCAQAGGERVPAQGRPGRHRPGRAGPGGGGTGGPLDHPRALARRGARAAGVPRRRGRRRRPGAPPGRGVGARPVHRPRAGGGTRARRGDRARRPPAGAAPAGAVGDPRARAAPVRHHVPRRRAAPRPTTPSRCRRGRCTSTAGPARRSCWARSHGGPGRPFLPPGPSSPGWSGRSRSCWAAGCLRCRTPPPGPPRPAGRPGSSRSWPGRPSWSPWSREPSGARGTRRSGRTCGGSTCCCPATRGGAMTRLVRAANPGPMTLDGTNTWLVGRAAGAGRRPRPRPPRRTWRPCSPRSAGTAACSAACC